MKTVHKLTVLKSRPKNIEVERLLQDAHPPPVEVAQREGAEAALRKLSKQAQHQSLETEPV
jgi:hypothetical protein